MGDRRVALSPADAWRRARNPDEVTSPADVAHFRRLVASLECGDPGGLWDLPCARLVLTALERRLADLNNHSAHGSVAR